MLNVMFLYNVPIQCYYKKTGLTLCYKVCFSSYFRKKTEIWIDLTWKPSVLQQVQRESQAPATKTNAHKVNVLWRLVVKSFVGLPELIQLLATTEHLVQRTTTKPTHLEEAAHWDERTAQSQARWVRAAEPPMDGVIFSVWRKNEARILTRYYRSQKYLPTNF